MLADAQNLCTNKAANVSPVQGIRGSLDRNHQEDLPQWCFMVRKVILGKHSALVMGLTWLSYEIDVRPCL